jgi:hypothetical protein
VGGSAVVGVAEGEGLEVHAFGHVHALDLLVDDADGLDLHAIDLVAVEAVLAGAVHAALHPSRKASAVLLVALRLLAGAEDALHLVLVHDCARLHLPLGLDLDALPAAQLVDALLVKGVVAGAGLHLALEVAQADVVDLPALLVRKPLHFKWLALETGLERVESNVYRVGFPIVLARLRNLRVLGQYLLVQI